MYVTRRRACDESTIARSKGLIASHAMCRTLA